MTSLQAMKSYFEDYNSSESSSDDEFEQMTSLSQRKMTKRRQRNVQYDWRNGDSDASLDSCDSSTYNDVDSTSHCSITHYSSTYDDVDTTSHCSITRHSNSRYVRKTSIDAVKKCLTDRRRALKKIQETWFTFDDYSSDSSDDSSEWSSSSSLQDLVVKCSTSDTYSVSDESSGYYEGSFESSSKQSLYGNGLSSDGYCSETDCKCCETSGICKAKTIVKSENVSSKGRQLNFDIFRRGFGTNRWYKRKQRAKVETGTETDRDSGVSLQDYEKYMESRNEQFTISRHRRRGFGANNWYKS